MQTPFKKRVLLLSTVHLASDPRIVGKILPTLSADYEVGCVLAQNHELLYDAAAKTASYQAPIKTVRFYSQLWKRLLCVHPSALWHFLCFRPHIVHIFVAELLPLAFIFRGLGAEVIYEVQENLYKKMPTKTYNKGWLFEHLFRFFDQKARQYFYFVFTEDAYLNEYQELSKPHAIVHNFAIVRQGEEDKSSTSDGESPTSNVERRTSNIQPQTSNVEPPTSNAPTFFYAGVISFERGFDTMLAAVAKLKQHYPDVCLKVFGHQRFLVEQLQQLSDYERIKDNVLFYGYVPQAQAFAHASGCIAGIALLKPVGDYADSYPTKLFDYMTLGLPVLASDLPLLKSVVEVHECGFCVSAYDAEALAEKMDWLIKNPEAATKMAANGQGAVGKYYNWYNEGRELLRLYRLLAMVGSRT